MKLILGVILCSILYAKDITYQKNETFTLKKGETISELLNRTGYGHLLLYGEERVVKKVLKINNLDEESAKKLEIGQKIYIPKNIFLNDKIFEKSQKPNDKNSRSIETGFSENGLFDTDISPFFSFSSESMDEKFSFTGGVIAQYSKLEGRQNIGAGSGSKALDLLSDLSPGVSFYIDYFQKKKARYKWTSRIKILNQRYSKKLADQVQKDFSLISYDLAAGAGYFFNKDWDMTGLIGYKAQANYFADGQTGEIEFFLDDIPYLELSSSYVLLRYKMGNINKFDHISTIAFKLGLGISGEGEFLSNGHYYYTGLLWNIIKGWTLDVEYQQASFERDFLDTKYTATHIALNRNLHF